MTAHKRSTAYRFRSRKSVRIIVLFVFTTLCARNLPSQLLHGFTLTGDPASANGATWTYQDTVQGIFYDLTGILFKPTGNSNLPAVVISHGHGGNVSTYGVSIARVMRSWGLVCIATNYTHAGGVPIGSPGASTQPGASFANILRARKCVEILDCHDETVIFVLIDTGMQHRNLLWSCVTDGS